MFPVKSLISRIPNSLTAADVRACVCVCLCKTYANRYIDSTFGSFIKSLLIVLIEQRLPSDV